ncbi:MAG: hypothetical protein WDW36_003467 [Sanguina aurantia]
MRVLCSHIGCNSAFLGVFRYSGRALQLVWSTSRPLTIALALLTLVAGLLPAGVALIGAHIVDAVVSTSRLWATQGNAPWWPVIRWVLLEGLLVALLAGLRSATKARREAAASMDSSISGSSFLESEPDSNGSGSGVFTAAAAAAAAAAATDPDDAQPLQSQARCEVVEAERLAGEAHQPMGGLAVADADGILRKEGGYPWDADIARRFLCYASTTVVVALYGRLLGSQGSLHV